jgi:hypothetical protein
VVTYVYILESWYMFPHHCHGSFLGKIFVHLPAKLYAVQRWTWARWPVNKTVTIFLFKDED